MWDFFGLSILVVAVLCILFLFVFITEVLPWIMFGYIVLVVVGSIKSNNDE